MISAAGRRALDRYALAAREMSASSGDRTARETGNSVEFQDFRSYQPGDELRAVDWRAYARSRRLVTRLYRAERTIDVHVVLDVSPSMGLAGKLDYARIVAELVSYVGQRDAITRVHTTAGVASPVAQGRVGLARAWGLLEEAVTVAGGPGPVEGVRSFALALPKVRGAALAVVISDLFDPQPWRPALVALRARGLDAAFLQVVSDDDLHPPEGRFEILDAESDERRTVGPEEVRAYRTAVQAFLKRTRSALAQAGVSHVLLRVPTGVGTAIPATARRPEGVGWRPAQAADAALDPERSALAALRRARVLVPR